MAGFHDPTRPFVYDWHTRNWNEDLYRYLRRLVSRDGGPYGRKDNLYMIVVCVKQALNLYRRPSIQEGA